MNIELYRQNPWWDGKEFFERDYDYQKWKLRPFKWEPAFSNTVKLKHYGLNFLFGPRQVGKTTAIKFIIKRLLEQGINEKAIFYFRCDSVDNYKELDTLLKEYRLIAEAANIKTAYVFLDEITYVKEWYRTVKDWVDLGLFQNDVVFLSGSLSMYVKGDVETFPGRRGFGQDYILWPLSFREYIRVHNLELFKKLPVIDLFSVEKMDLLFNKPLLYEQLQSLFDKYLKYGGFPLSEDKNAIETYTSGVRGDILKLGKDDATAKRILKAIIKKLPSTYSYNSIARDFEVGSHNTVFAYVDLFEKLYVLKILNCIDLNKMIENILKDKKIHLMDPFLYTVFSIWAGEEIPDKEHIVESVVATHLSRLYSVGYWKNSSEIDVIIKNKGKIIGVEVKYGKKAKEIKMVVGQLNKIYTLSKDIFEKNSVIPVSLFLACIDV